MGRHAHGAYLLRTNCREEDPAKVWRWYMQLTQAEDAFRVSKSDLSLRPVFHHKTERVEAHILVCFLSLTLWRTLEMWMNGKGLGNCARQLIKEVSTVRSLDVVLPVQETESQRSREVRLRVVARPDRPVAELVGPPGFGPAQRAQNRAKCSGEKRALKLVNRSKSTHAFSQMTNLG